MKALRVHQTKAFSLIELMAVVAIIGLLIGILVPSLSRARKSAKTTVCGTHLHQLGISTEMYLNESKCYPPHKWSLPDGGNDRWPTAVAIYLRSEEPQICPQVPAWKVGRNNSYGYNYKYLGSLRFNDQSPTAPYERFPVKTVANPSSTIAYADSDGTGWTKPYQADGKDANAIGNHGYTLDPTFIYPYAAGTVNNEGEKEAWAYLEYRSYISTRHRGASNVVWLDGHVDKITPGQVYRDNRFWNGLGVEDAKRDPHVNRRVGTGVFRFEDEIQ